MSIRTRRSTSIVLIYTRRSRALVTNGVVHTTHAGGSAPQVPNANIALGKIALVGTAGSSNSRACIDIAKKSLHKEKPCSPAPCGFNGAPSIAKRTAESSASFFLFFNLAKS